MPVTFHAIASEIIRTLQEGGPDAYGLTPERKVSDGDGVPCRHCLNNIATGEPYLVLAFRPFPRLQPYAETGPIFLHADPCRRAEDGPALPAILTNDSYIVRGYDAGDRIVYGTGQVTPTAEIAARSESLLRRDDVAYLHVRSARNNCYQCRIERG